MLPLFSAHPLVLETAFAELKRLASEQSLLLVGTPGSVGTRQVGGRSFLYRQFYDAAGKKASAYIGPAEDANANARADAIREAIAMANGLLETARLLARQGYVRVDTETGAVVTALASHGLFRAGAILVGSHAFGALLNELGVRAAAYLTEDVDIARNTSLELASEAASFQSMLDDSTLQLTPVPALDRKTPPTSYRAAGRRRLRVDLLVPTRGHAIVARPVPELHSHATALPHLAYLLDAPLHSVLLGRESVVPVNVPRPERFVFHKMLVSQRRHAESSKRTKDIQQAAVLFAVLAEKDPAALENAFAAVESTRKTAAGARQVLSILEKSPHTRAAELLRDLLR